MPFNMINFPSQLGQQEPSFFERLQGIQQGEQNLQQSQHRNQILGAEAQFAPQNEAEKYAQMQSKTFMDDLERQYKEKQIIADLKYKHAQALHHAQQAKGENQYAPHDYEKLESAYDKAVEKYGPESEKAKRAKMALDGYLSSHGENRFAPTKTTKIDQELALARAKDPNSQETKNLELAANKERSDQSTRTKALAAKNLETSMESIDPDAITYYSGPAGQLKLKQEQLMDMLGSPSPEYQRYKESLVAAKFEAKQLRQMLGESVREKVAKELEIISNPSSFGTSPETAKLMLLKAREILKRELRTFQEAQVSTEPYKGTKGKEEAIKAVESGQPSQKNKSYTKEDILETARQTGKTVAEIEELIRIAEEGK